MQNAGAIQVDNMWVIENDQIDKNLIHINLKNNRIKPFFKVFNEIQSIFYILE